MVNVSCRNSITTLFFLWHYYFSAQNSNKLFFSINCYWHTSQPYFYSAFIIIRLVIKFLIKLCIRPFIKAFSKLFIRCFGSLIQVINSLIILFFIKLDIGLNISIEKYLVGYNFCNWIFSFLNRLNLTSSFDIINEQWINYPKTWIISYTVDL